MNTDHVLIRKTTSDDFEAIMTVEERAFGYDKEAKLTASLLDDPTAEPMLSLLAFDHDKAIGHILFTRAYIDELSKDQPLIHLLAPLAVIPEYQKQGIGGKLIEAGLELLKEMGSEMVFVLGHISYYPRYGFIPDAKKQGYPAPYPIPDEVADAWMVQSLNAEEPEVPKGQVLCCNALDEPEHWRE